MHIDLSFLQPLLAQGWGTAAACLAGAIALLAALRSALGKVELALREKLFVIAAAGGLATLGITAPWLTQGHVEEVGELVRREVSTRPDLAFGVAVVVALVVVGFAVVAWVRFLVRTALRLAALGLLLGVVGAWALGRFVLVSSLDGWAGTHLGAEGWRTLFDVGGVAFVVLLGWRSLRTAR